MPTVTDESNRVVAPALPTGPATYSKSYIDRFNNILRLYFNQLDNALRNAVATAVPYTLRVAEGQVTGATSLFKFGFNADVDTTEETVWSGGGDLVYPGAAGEVYISSDDTNDVNPAGTGARTIKIQGLDANYLEIEEDIALSNISLDLFGRANLFLEYAASIKGDGISADDLAFKRNEAEFKPVNAIPMAFIMILGYHIVC